MKLAILTPTLDHGAVTSSGRIGDRTLLERMANILDAQIEKLPIGDQAVHFIYPDDGKLTTGYKRNALMEKAKIWGADHITQLDDDDLPGATYIKRIFEGMRAGADCCELWGQIYWDGVPGKPFHHSIIHKEWSEDDKFYYRMPNHLNAIKLALVKDIPFPDQSFGEDGKWSYAVRDAGVLKKEHPIKDIIYHYFCGKIKNNLNEASQLRIV